LYKECSSLAKNYETHLIAVNDVPKIVNKVKVHTFPKFKSRLLRILFAPILMFFKAMKINAEIYHIHDPELIFCALALKFFFKKKIIFDVHEHIKKHFKSKPYHIPFFVMKIITFAYSFIENNLFNKFDLIITATPLIKKEVYSFNNNVQAINNFPIISEVKQLNEKKNHSVCYVGAITKDRGILEMIKALEFDDKIRLSLAGGFVSEELREESMQQKGWKNVDYFGFVDREKVYEIMGKSFAGMIILATINNYLNSFPNKMFEYMLAGIPIIASDFPLWKEILDGVDCAVFVNPNNIEEIYNAVKYLNENPKIAEQMGRNGREKVLSDYNWEKEEKKLYEVYQNLEGCKC
jgi:glycosyltransferase involved in cell wall biosynthesis